MLEIASILEAVMVITFGLSWPMNIANAWKARTARGTSVSFYGFIFVGYICAIVGKLCTIHYYVDIAQTAQSWTDAVKWYVMFFYVLNALMVFCGIMIYFRNRSLDRKAASQ